MITDNFIMVLAALGVFQAFFLCLYLVMLKKGNRTANILLVIILAGITIRIGKSLIGYYIPLVAWQRNIGISGALIAGPCLWFYGKALFEKNKPFAIANYTHLLPFVLFVLMIGMIPSDGEFAIFWNYGIVVFHLAAYIILSWVYLKKKSATVQKNVSNWYRNILIAVSIIWAYYLANFLDLGMHYITGPIFYTFIIYSLSYLFLNRQHLNLEKYGSSTIDQTTSRRMLEKIKMIFEKDRIFLDPDLSIDAVAEQVKLSPRVLSQTINEHGGQMFAEFVNQFRIDHAKVLLKDSKYSNEKISTIAYDSGFGTVTSFNVSFKKMTGLTPSEFRKRVASQSFSS